MNSLRFDLHNGKPPEDYLIIDRSSIYGNPFSIKKHGREQCLKMYYSYIYTKIILAIEKQDTEFLSSLIRPEILEGRLACWCAPNQDCHGDILTRAGLYVKASCPWL